MIIALNGLAPRPEHFEALGRLLALAASYSDSPLRVEPAYYESIKHLLPADAAPGSAAGSDMALSIGGDGTFLRTVQWLAGADVPILGINTGHLGYLADLSLEEAIAPDCGDFVVQRRTMLEVSIEQGGVPADFHPYALNEVAFLKKDTSSMIATAVEVNGAPLTTYLGDGLIVSTPTGSTGYNLSVGGPIIAPTAPALVLSPVAPHSLTMRPLVVDDNSAIRVTTAVRGDEFLLSLDGKSLALKAGTTVLVRKAAITTGVMQRRSRNFADTLRSKLLWGLAREHAAGGFDVFAATGADGGSDAQ